MLNLRTSLSIALCLGGLACRREPTAGSQAPVAERVAERAAPTFAVYWSSASLPTFASADLRTTFVRWSDAGVPRAETLPGLWLLEGEGPAARVVAWHFIVESAADDPARESALLRSLWCAPPVECELSPARATRTVLEQGRATREFRDPDDGTALDGVLCREPVEASCRGSECDDPCAEYSTALRGAISLFGGRLYLLGVYDNAGCSGVHQASGSARAIDLLPSPGRREAVADGARTRDCALVRDLEVPPAIPHDEELAADEACPQGSSEAWAVDHGELVRLRLGADPRDGTCLCAERFPVASARCPTAEDACGDLSWLAARDGLDNYWGGAERRALVVRDGRVGVVEGERAPVWLADAPNVLGVRYHADGRPLHAVLEDRKTAGAADPFGAGAVRLPEPLAACAGDELAGLPALALAPDDRALDDDTGRAWGNRCFAHLKAGRLLEAEAACLRGVAVAREDAVLGALHYNLGRIAEARSHRGLARISYKRSLEHRPGNAAAKTRLEALSPRDEPPGP